MRPPLFHSVVSAVKLLDSELAENIYYEIDDVQLMYCCKTVQPELTTSGCIEHQAIDNRSIKKLYLSAILDLYDRRIVAYKIGDSNNNHLVFSTFDEAIEHNPDAHPIFHSDRGFQYTNKTFHKKLVDAGMIQSMSRVGRCIDNGPMEGWWGILKSEMYYLRKFTDKTELVSAIEEYITYYNTRRYQIKLSSMTPMEYHEVYAA